MKSRQISNPRNNDIISVSLVVPVYNEFDTIKMFLEALNVVFPPPINTLIHGNIIDVGHKQFGYQLNVIFVNDGSTDRTLDTLLYHSKLDDRLTVIDLSRNFGKEAALTAGLLESDSDVTIPIDVDLQDPISLIPELIKKWREGYDVVLARRIDRKNDSWMKRNTAELFYRLHNVVSEIQIPKNVGDFRLMDRSVIEAIRLMPESRRFMKGIFAWVGFRTTYVDYTRPPRVAGYSKFSPLRLLNLAIEGITSFSIVPLKIWTTIGLTVSVSAIAYAVFLLINVLNNGIDVPGYASLMISIAFLGGMQLVGIGLLGEYVDRIYMESNGRPL